MTALPVPWVPQGICRDGVLWDWTPKSLLPLEPPLFLLFTAQLLCKSPLPHLPLPVHFSLASATAITLPKTSLAEVIC